MRYDVCDLVLDACDLLERAAQRASVDELLASEVELLRAELCAALATCQDAAVEADGRACLAALDALLARSAPAEPLLAVSA